jgi:hypothetical protein
MNVPREVLVFAFDAPRARFEGAIVGALERAESGGAIRIVEAVVAARDADSGALACRRLRGGAGSLVTALTDFRLAGPEASDHEMDADTAQKIGAALAPGTAVAAVVLEHRWLAALDDAAERAGGSLLAREPWPQEDADLADRAARAACGVANEGGRG